MLVERTLLKIKECMIFQLPANKHPRGHVAETWTDLLWKGGLKVIERESECIIRLEDDEGVLFAESFYTSTAVVEPTVDSSRFFVLQLTDKNTKSRAYVGLGFTERSDSFDLLATLQDFMSKEKREKKKNDSPVDFSLKDGELLYINVGNTSAQPQWIDAKGNEEWEQFD